MSEWSERKRGFYRDVVRHGVTELSQLTKVYPLGWPLENEKLEVWLRRFKSVPEVSTSTSRLVNHFMTGADPEFIFVDPEDDRRYDATSFGMQQGRAFGADNNGRLAEIRPHPDKSQLKVLASIHATLRWMMLTVKGVQKLQLHCGAFLHQDGLGGHVHLGRKRKDERPKEVQGLDSLALSLESLGMFPIAQMNARREGDQFHQRYGLPGDIRPQNHGYEYRTFPSWLDSPWLAYFTLVLSKLAVFDPELFEVRTRNYAKHLEYVLRYYRGLDDDALLALHMLQRNGLPKHIGGDFRARWGLNGYTTMDKTVKYIPSSIPAHESDVQALWEYFAQGTPVLSGVTPVVTWTPVAPPEGFTCVIDYVRTHGAKGLGEMVYDLAIRTEDTPWLMLAATKAVYNPLTREECALGIGRKSAKYLPYGWQQKLPENAWTYIEGLGVQIGAKYREGTLGKETKKMLLGGAFPIWKIQDANKEAHANWLAGFKQKKPTAALIGRVEA